MMIHYYHPSYIYSNLLYPNMKLFLDTADVESVKKVIPTGLIQGVTTNPTLIKKAGLKPLDVYKELVELGVPDISMEVVADTVEDFRSKAYDLYSELPEHQVTIKLPCTPAGLEAAGYIGVEGIKTNITLVFSAAQAILCNLVNATYISPFIGRLCDNSHDGLGLIKDISQIYTNDDSLSGSTQILAASIRDVPSISKAFANGADICTIPPHIFWDMYKHVLTDTGIQQFNKDYAETPD